MIIYGRECPLPPKESLGKALSNEGHTWFRTVIPDFMNEFETDKSGIILWNDKQFDFIDRELERCENGVYYIIRGELRYFPGHYYYYLNYWTLENGKKPEYREADRKFFIFFESVENDPYVLGIVRGKKRREGATSQGTCISVKKATFGKNVHNGNISKTGKDASDMFQNMIVYGYKKLHPFLKVRTDSGNNPKTKLNFVEPAKKGKAANEHADATDSGLNSYIDFRNTELNSYDSGRYNLIIIDEAGKWIEVNINDYLNIVQQVVKEGASKRGILYIPSTVNPPEKGGRNFQKMWDLADHIKYEGRTPKRMVRYFQPAEEGLNGFVDQFGDSVIEEPDEVTLAYLVSVQEKEPPGERIPTDLLSKGAAKYLDDELAMLADDSDISEHKRMYPRREADMFDFGDTTSPFSQDKLKKAKERINNRESRPIRTGRFFMNFEGKVEWTDDPKGLWRVTDLAIGRNNKIIKSDRRDGTSVVSAGGVDYGIGVDTYRFDKTQSLGSNGVINVGKRADDGIGPRTVALYVGRPKLTELFWKEIMLACIYYGCTATFEKDATQEYVKYFENKMANVLDCNCKPLLGMKPDAAVDPTRKTNDKDLKPGMYVGVSSADPFVFSKQINLGVSYVEYYWSEMDFIDEIEDMLDFNPDDRTKSDRTIGKLIMLMNIQGDNVTREKVKKRSPMVETYVVSF